MHRELLSKSRREEDMPPMLSDLSRTLSKQCNHPLPSRYTIFAKSHRKLPGFRGFAPTSKRTDRLYRERAKRLSQASCGGRLFGKVSAITARPVPSSSSQDRPTP